MDGTFLNVCLGGTSSGGDGLRRPVLESASLVVLEEASLLWLMLDDGTRGGGTGWFAVASVSGTASVVEGASAASCWNGSLGRAGDGAGDEANDEALEGIDAFEGPLPLFHAAALLRASKLEGRWISVPSSLAMTQPLLLLLDWIAAAARSPCAEVAAIVVTG